MLALWEYFWDRNDWTDQEPAQPPHGHGHRDIDSDQYRAFDEDYWNARKARQSKAPPPPKFDPSSQTSLGTVADRRAALSAEVSYIRDTQPHLLALQSELDNVKATLRASPTLADMQQHTAYFRVLKTELDLLARAYARHVAHAEKLRESLLNT